MKLKGKTQQKMAKIFPDLSSWMDINGVVLVVGRSGSVLILFCLFSRFSCQTYVDIVIFYFYVLNSWSFLETWNGFFIIFFPARSGCGSVGIGEFHFEVLYKNAKWDCTHLLITYRALWLCYMCYYLGCQRQTHSYTNFFNGPVNNCCNWHGMWFSSEGFLEESLKIWVKWALWQVFKNCKVHTTMFKVSSTVSLTKLFIEVWNGVFNSFHIPVWWKLMNIST